MNTLDEVRRKIDVLDQKLITLLAAEAGLSPDVAEAVWRAMIEAFIRLETDVNQARE